MTRWVNQKCKTNNLEIPHSFKALEWNEFKWIRIIYVTIIFSICLLILINTELSQFLIIL